MVIEDIHVRGLLVLRQRAIMEALCGPARFAQALASLPEDMRAEYDAATSLGWVRQSTVRAVTQAAAAQIAADPVRFAGDVVEQSITDAVRGVWAVLVRNTNDDALLSRAATIFEKSFDRGRFRAASLGPGRAEIVLEGWADPHEMDIVSIERSIAAVLRVAGRTASRVTTSRVGARVRFDVQAHW